MGTSSGGAGQPACWRWDWRAPSASSSRSRYRSQSALTTRSSAAITAGRSCRRRCARRAGPARRHGRRDDRRGPVTTSPSSTPRPRPSGATLVPLRFPSRGKRSSARHRLSDRRPDRRSRRPRPWSDPALPLRDGDFVERDHGLGRAEAARLLGPRAAAVLEGAPWGDVRPPHLDGFLRSRRGESRAAARRSHALCTSRSSASARRASVRTRSDQRASGERLLAGQRLRGGRVDLHLDQRSRPRRPGEVHGLAVS